MKTPEKKNRHAIMRKKDLKQQDWSFLQFLKNNTHILPKTIFHRNFTKFPVIASMVNKHQYKYVFCSKNVI